MNELALYERQFDGIAASTNPFPVDFDQAWQWVGYSTKSNALRVLQENFEETVDFCSSEMMSKKEGRGGHNERVYFLTVDCFKSFCMMAGTEKGKEVRKYYLAIEKKYYELRQTLVSRLEQDYREVCREHGELQNVYHQNENYRIKYINLLDKLENKGMAIKEIWELSKVDRGFLTEYRQKMIADEKAYREGGEWGRMTALKQAPGGATQPLEAPQEAKRQESTDDGKGERRADTAAKPV
jgi:phage anti-repressor protein